MRLPVAVLALAALPSAAIAQNGPYIAVVSDAEVRMRAGESDRFPDAGTLHRGTKVLVDHEEPGGWLAIQAPPGAVSWVQMHFLEFDATLPKPQNAVLSQDVTLVAGRVGHAQPLVDVRRATVPAGSILTVIGEKAVVEGKSWYPVAPPADDFRYIPKSSVQMERAANTSYTVKSTDTGTPTGAIPASATNTGSIPAPAGGLPTGSTTPLSKPTPTVNHPLWAQAEAAEREGKYREAEEFLSELARKMGETGGDFDVANQCFTRIHTLREKQRGTRGTATATPPRDDRPSLAPPGRGTVSLPPPAKDNRPATTATAAGEWSKAAMLVRANIAIDGKPTYALESAPGNVVAYVVGAQGLDLERHKNRRVVVFGTKSERNLSRPLIVATAVDPGVN